MINVFTGRCEPMYGACPYCSGALVAGHKCPGQEAAEAILRDTDSAGRTPKLASMIRLWIAANNVDQLHLAKQWGVPTSVVSRFLNGKNMPDGKSTARIISWLLEP